MSAKSINARDENVYSDDKKGQESNSDGGRIADKTSENLNSSKFNNKTASQTKINEELKVPLLPAKSNKIVPRDNQNVNVAGESGTNEEANAKSNSKSTTRTDSASNLKNLIDQENNSADDIFKLNAPSGKVDSGNPPNTLLHNIGNLERELAEKEKKLMHDRMVIMNKREKLAKVRKLAEGDDNTAKSIGNDASLHGDIQSLKNVISDIKGILLGNRPSGTGVSSNVASQGIPATALEQNKRKSQTEKTRSETNQGEHVNILYKIYREREI